MAEANPESDLDESAEQPSPSPPPQPDNNAATANSDDCLPGPSTSSTEFASSEKKDKTRKIFLFAHKRSHIVMVEGSAMYRCDVCLSMYRHTFSLKRHFLRNHVSVKYISHSDINNCKINVNRLVTGDQTDDDSDEDEEEEESDDDEEESDSSSSLHERRRECNGEVIITGDPAEGINGLFRCHLCIGSRFDSRSDLTEHFKTHLNSPKCQFPCEKCNVVFSNKQALYRHLSTHSETTIPCTSCGMTFEDRESYHVHSLTHTDGRTCKYCSKVLSTKANKSRHERIHEGLKPYPCKHCNSQFTQSGDLKKHVKKEHAMLYIACPICDNLFSSKTALNKHRVDQHGDQRPEEPPPSPESPVTPVSQRCLTHIQFPVETESHDKQRQKAHHCPVCKKRYSSYLSMLQHKRHAHPFAAKSRKVHKKYYTRRQKIFNKRNGELSENDFFRTLPDMIADNLVNYVDGKTSQLSLRQYNFSESVDNYCPATPQFWSRYNFPENFDFDHAVVARGYEVTERPTGDNFAMEEEESYGGRGYSPLYDAFNGHVEIPDREESLYAGFQLIDYKNINVEERKKCIGRVVRSVILCCVCKETLPNVDDFNVHSENNHPNVLCNYIEIEGDKDLPPVIPDDMKKHFLSPVGECFSYTVPPPFQGQTSVSCTKCDLVLGSMSELHGHIISCGGNERIAPKHVRRILAQRKIKRTMKKRMNTDSLDRSAAKKQAAKAVAVQENTPKSPATPNPSAPLVLNPVPKASVGRPKINLSILCPHCSQSFRTKTLLNGHINRCYKTAVMKNKSPSMALKKTAAPRSENVSKPQVPKNSVPAPSRCSEVPVQKRGAPLSMDQSTVLPRIESPVERLSPSLEVIVNSIKEKLTAEELSPLNPTFSWMEGDAFVGTDPTPSVIPEIVCQQANEAVIPDVAIIDNTAVIACASTSMEGVETSGASGMTQTKEDDISVEAPPPSGESKPLELKIEKDTIGPIKPNVQKYKPKANPYVKKRRRKNKPAVKLELPVVEAGPSGLAALKSPPVQVAPPLDSSSSNIPASNGCNLVEDSPQQAMMLEALPLDSTSSNIPDSNVCSLVEDSPQQPMMLGSTGKTKKVNKKLVCPYCMRDFAHVPGFHRHMDSCLQKKQKELEVQPGCSSQLFLLPKRDEVEESMLNLLRHQSRQSKMMREILCVDPLRNFHSYTCDICHKIFLSLFKVLQHRFVHKLQKIEEQNRTVKEEDTSDTPIPGPSTTIKPLEITTSIPNPDSPGPSSAPACLEPSLYFKEQSAAESAILRLRIPKSSTSINYPCPSSAPIRLETTKSPTSVAPQCSKSSTESQVKQVAGTELSSPLTPKASSDVTDKPIDQSGSSSSKSPLPKKRKKVKKIVVRKHAHTTKENVKKRSVNKESSNSSQMPDSNDTARNANTKPNSIPRSPNQFRSIPSTSESDRTCLTCGKVFYSLKFKKRHMVLKHSDVPSQIAQEPSVKQPNAIKKKLAKKKKNHKRNVPHRECKIKVIPTKSPKRTPPPRK